MRIVVTQFLWWWIFVNRLKNKIYWLGSRKIVRTKIDQ